MWIGIVCQRVRSFVIRMCIHTYILMYVHTCGDAAGNCVSDGASLCIDTYIHRYVCIFIYIRIYVHACDVPPAAALTCAWRPTD